jgi:shikimate dehydrogenase
MRVAGVCGWPIAHSKSPLIHGHWLARAGLNGAYVPLALHPAEAAVAFRNLGRMGFAGVNVTVPLKGIAFDAADRMADCAREVGAANLLLATEEGLLARNTDLDGSLAPIRVRGLRPETAVLIGAGGAARAVVAGLRTLGVRVLWIVNRSAAPAAELAAMWPGAAVLALAPGLRLPPADLLVNASSLGMAGQPPLDVRLDALPAHAFVFDLVYAPVETALLAAARARGLTVIDGLEMLVAQAAPAFEALFGVPPDRTADAELRARLVRG